MHEIELNVDALQQLILCHAKKYCSPGQVSRLEHCPIQQKFIGVLPNQIAGSIPCQGA